MPSALENFTKKSEYLICVDSDGCAMDTMDIKHIRCFGPCLVSEWGLFSYSEEILCRWNEINLYSMTRGINRFKALAIALCEINERYCQIEDLNTLIHWTENSRELSEPSLLRAIEQNSSCTSLKKALSWSRAVNKSITELSLDSKKPFELCLEALKAAHKSADVAVVSSANHDAVIEEWERFSLLEHTDIVLSQSDGSKAFCISELLKNGYEPKKVLMCGDAPGDLDAAEKNGVLFFPILVGHEKQSWQEFISLGLSRLVNGEYIGQYAQNKKTEFLKNLGGK